MRKTMTITYPAAPERVSQMLSSPDYQRSRVAGLGLEDLSVDVVARSEGFTVTIAGTVPPGRLPSTARGFVRGPLAVQVTESWDAPSPGASRSGSLTVALEGAPGRLGAVSQLAPTADGASTRLALDVSVEVSIPLLGRRVEQMVLEGLGTVAHDEEQRGSRWLAEH